MADAAVEVLYLPPPTSDAIDYTQNLPDMLDGSGLTDATGTVSTTLDTSMVNTSDLGDDGDGTGDAFNVDVVALDAAGNESATAEVVTLGSSFSDAADPAEPASPPGNGTPNCVTGPGTRYINRTSTLWLPVTAENSGGGMEAELSYTQSSSIAKQTDMTAAISFNGLSYHASKYHMEERDRSTTSPWDVSGDYHQFVFAHYETAQWNVCPQNFNPKQHTGHPYFEWDPLHWNGALSDDDPDVGSNGETVGYQPYVVPTFTPGPNDIYTVTLTTQQSTFSRSSGTRVAQGANDTFSILEDLNTKVGQFVASASKSFDVKATYGAITKMTYVRLPSGCPSGHSRVVWGYNSLPTLTERLQADCEPNSNL
jgi:hypothetical protein